MTVSVPDGSAIQWRYKSSDTSGNWTGLSYITADDMNSATVDCPQAVTVSSSQDLGSCSGSGTATSTLTVTNTSGSTAYVKVEYSTDGGSTYTEKNASATILTGTGSLFSENVSHGSAITWRVTSSDTSASFTGLTPTTVASGTVDCPVIDVSASQALGSCSAGAATSTLTLSNSNSANTTAYFLVEYSVDGGSTWTEKAANQSVAKNASETLTQSVSHDAAIQWRYKSSTTSGSFSGSYVTSSDMNSATVDCPIIDVSASQSLGSCSSGAKTSTLTINNSDSANAVAYVLVEYSLDGGSNWTEKAANQTVNNNGSATLTQSVPHNSAIQWRYKTSTTSGSYSGSYVTSSDLNSATVDLSLIHI